MPILLSDGLPPEMADDLPEWLEFGEPLEGRVYGMYLDIKALLTVGVGNLTDTVREALALPWRHTGRTDTKPATASDPLASPDEVAAAWHDIKEHTALRTKHYRYALARNDLRLTVEAVNSLVFRRLFEFEAYMQRHHFPGWRDFPADAQLAICSIAWACGPGFPGKFVHFAEAARNGDWMRAAAECTIKEAGNPGVVPRNIANRLCLRNAHTVQRLGLDLDQLWWPDVAEEPDVPLPKIPKPIGPALIPLHVNYDEL